MDALDQIAAPAADLLARVDDLLARAGAPDGHPIWPLLRRVRAMPGDAAGAIVALRPAPLAAAGSALRELTSGYDDARVALSVRPLWEGAGAEAFDAQRTALAAFLGNSAESLTGRLDATASYLDAIADWACRSRRELAVALADVLRSAEAVAVVAGESSGELAARAAADIATRVLTVAAESVDRAQALVDRWGPRLAELPYRPPEPPAATRPETTTRLAY